MLSHLTSVSKNTWTNCSSNTLLQFVQVFLKQTLLRLTNYVSKNYSILISNPPKANVRYKRKEKEIHFPSLKCYHDLVRTVKNKRKGKIQGAKTIFHAMAASSWYSFLEKRSQLGQSLYNFLEIVINLLFFHHLLKKSQIWEYLFPLMSVGKNESTFLNVY